ncbi:MAG TPA: divalent-cation tolerance protein CutA [Acidobacteriaceae bacterium]|nr:divalent-cation tolerance protein CutA [Acidobacteriaceae bacterium]
MPDVAGPVRVVLTTVSSPDEGRRVARLLVERRLAACINLIPNMTSIYRWQGGVEVASEVLMVIKTRADQIPALESAVRELHTYQVPEFLVLEVESGGRAYLDWLLSSVGD